MDEKRPCEGSDVRTKIGALKKLGPPCTVQKIFGKSEASAILDKNHNFFDKLTAMELGI